MSHHLPDLPYAHEALEPHISRETLEYHHDKHHAAYVKNLNGLVEGSEYAGKELAEIVKTAPPGGIFNNAAQAWNHAFYFAGLKARGNQEPFGPLAEAIVARWGDVGAFREAFSRSAVSNFGSGWTWLVRTAAGELEIINTSNAGSPLTEGATPILCIDVWEHAYYIDVRNARPKYVENWWKVVDWEAAARNFEA
jgi:Fe-Mn family superoxide dismutase